MTKNELVKQYIINYFHTSAQFRKKLAELKKARELYPDTN